MELTDALLFKLSLSLFKIFNLFINTALLLTAKKRKAIPLI